MDGNEDGTRSYLPPRQHERPSSESGMQRNINEIACIDLIPA